MTDVMSSRSFEYYSITVGLKISFEGYFFFMVSFTAEMY